MARTLHIQVQPRLVESLDVLGLHRAFQAFASQNSLVLAHRFKSGNDNGEYINFDFDTLRPAELWDQICSTVFDAAGFASTFSQASIAICTGQNGWDDYLLIHHWDPGEELDPVPAI